MSSGASCCARPSARANPRPWLAPVTTAILVILDTLSDTRAPIGALPGGSGGGGALRFEQRVRVLLGPTGQGADDRQQAAADVGQRVDTRRALDEPVALESVQRLGGHFFGDPADAFEQLAVAARSLPERHDHHDRPGVADNGQRRAGRAVCEEHVERAHPSMTLAQPEQVTTRTTPRDARSAMPDESESANRGDAHDWCGRRAGAAGQTLLPDETSRLLPLERGALAIEWDEEEQPTGHAGALLADHRRASDRSSQRAAAAFPPMHERDGRGRTPAAPTLERATSWRRRPQRACNRRRRRRRGGASTKPACLYLRSPAHARTRDLSHGPSSPRAADQ